MSGAELSSRLGFSGGRLDRMAERRNDAGFLAAESESPGRRVLVFAGDAPMLRAAAPISCLFGDGEARALGDIRETVYLGRLHGTPVFAHRIEPEPNAGEASAATVADLRALAVEGALERPLVALLGLARSLLSWHRRHGFCANCGARTVSACGGWRRDCASCQAEHFPRVDPVAIMVVTHGDDVLLGRQPRFAEKSYSCLAGFVEPGETVEDAVRREVREETGVVVGPVRFLASQPWPFPSSLMIGCHGEAESRAITIDRTELEDARWFPREELKAMIEGTHPDGLRVPPGISIASGMLRDHTGRHLRK